MGNQEKSNSDSNASLRGNPMDDWNHPTIKKIPRTKNSPPITNDHFLPIGEAREFAQGWTDFKNEFDELVESSSKCLTLDDLGKIIAKIQNLKKYLLINYEKFELTSDDEFQGRLIKLTTNSSYLQIVFGMKKIATLPKGKVKDKLKKNYPNKESISCIILVGRDNKGNVIPDL